MITSDVLVGSVYIISKLKDVDGATSILSSEAEKAMSSMSSFSSSDTSFKILRNSSSDVTLTWAILYNFCNFNMSDKRKLCIDSYIAQNHYNFKYRSENLSFSGKKNLKILNIEVKRSGCIPM